MNAELARSGDGLDARRLVAAATRAWLFGGMGSWNDLWLESRRDRERYRRVTRSLLTALLAALAWAVNSFDPSWQAGGA